MAWSLLAALLQHLSTQFRTFLATSFFFDLGFSIYFFLINLFLLGRGYNEKSLGIFTSAMVIGSLAGALPWGRLSQHIGIRPVWNLQGHARRESAPALNDAAS